MNSGGGAVSEIGEEAIRNALESLKAEMKEDGLDPMALEVQTITHRHATLSFEITLSLMVFKGLSLFRVEEVRLSIQDMKLMVSLSYDSLNLEGRYELKGKLIKLIPLSNRGPFYISTYRPLITIHARLYEKNGALQVKSLKSEIELHGVKSQLHRLPGSSMFSRILDNLLSQQLYKEKSRLAENLSTSLKSLLNNELKDMTFGVPIQILKTGDKLIRRGSKHL